MGITDDELERMAQKAAESFNEARSIKPERSDTDLVEDDFVDAQKYVMQGLKVPRWKKKGQKQSGFITTTTYGGVSIVGGATGGGGSGSLIGGGGTVFGKALVPGMITAGWDSAVGNDPHTDQGRCQESYDQRYEDGLEAGKKGKDDRIK